jgi:hypothetical protein
MKTVVFYITNYISKTPLKTHVIFDLIRSTLDKNTELIGGDATRQEKARSLITKMVNALTAKLEIGAPMAAMYLLGHPDHYTNRKFATFYWKSYVNHIRNSSNSAGAGPDENGNDTLEKVMIRKRGKGVVAISSVYDYIYRPSELDHICLYDWIHLSKKN